MKVRASYVAGVLIVAGVFGNCSSSDAGGRGRAALQQIGVQFQRPGLPREPGPAQRVPFFGEAWKAASFDAQPDGSLVARGQDEVHTPPRLASPGSDGLSTRFPATAAGDLLVEVQGAKDAWVKERLVGATSDARAEVVDGRLVYAQARPGIDRIYEVTAQRVEEYLRIADEQAPVRCPLANKVRFTL